MTSVASPSIAGRLRAVVELTKPRIIELLLVTTVPAMVVAADGWPSTWLVVATVLGGTLSAAGANALNNVLDSDIDIVMERTSGRPLPTDRLSTPVASAVGIGLGVAGFVLLSTAVNLLAAILSTAALLFYVGVYTLVLKRTTVENIVIGGAAGAVPALVGWAAVTGTVELPAYLMFAIVFLWTPPHFWALALRFKDDYAKAGIPMLPVVAGEDVTRKRMVLYSIATVVVSLTLLPASSLGVVYGISAGLLGVWFVWGAMRLWSQPDRAMRYFKESVYYLGLLFMAMAVDRLVG
ncbi:MAG: heme o synthase [Acidimicrobiia bacterium]|nr:heme o synthase [Acidimicrobiia bacterium]